MFSIKADHGSSRGIQTRLGIKPSSAIWAVISLLVLTTSIAAQTPPLWSSRRDLSLERAYSAIGIIKNKIYVAGGYIGSPVGAMEIYSPLSNTWTTGDKQMSRWHTAYGVIDGKLYIAGGLLSDAGGAENSLEYYDPVTDQWVVRMGMPTARKEASGAVAGGLFYIAGGYYGAILDTFEVYNPALNNWSALPRMISSRMSAAAATIDGKIYVAGGWDGSSALDSLTVFDPVANTWSNLASMPTARRNASAVELGGKLIVIGGKDNSGSVLDVVEVYDPSSNTWDTYKPMLTARTGAMTAAIDGRLYVIGGYDGTSYLTTHECYDPVPRIELDLISGTHSGNITFGYLLTDADSSQIALLAQYSTDGGSVWQAAAVSDDTTDISPAYYDSSLTWRSRDDLPEQALTGVLFRITPRDVGLTWGVADTIEIDIDNKPPSWIAATGSSGDTSIVFRFDEPVNDDTATDKLNFSLIPDSLTAHIDTITAVVSTESYRLTLADGWILPSPPDSVAIVVSNIADILGNIVSGTLDTTFIPTTGGPPSIVLDEWPPLAVGSTRIGFLISDSEHNLVSLYADYSIDTTGTGERIWLPATVAGDTSDIALAAYDSSLVWETGADLAGVDVDSVWFRITPRDTIGVAGAADTIVMRVDNRPPQWIGARAVSADTVIIFWFDEPVADTTATNTGNFTLSYGTNSLTVAYIQVLAPSDTFSIILGPGETVPVPPDSITITAHNIRDIHGNMIAGPLDTMILAGTGETPQIIVYPPSEVFVGDGNIHYLISDHEDNLVSLRAEFSSDGGTTWSPASVSGDTSAIIPDQFDGSLVWHTDTASDLSGQYREDVWFRITPRDGDTTWGRPDSVRVVVDNQAPEWMAAHGSSGDTVLTVCFNELVEESTAANSTNYTLSGGLTLQSGSLLEEYSILEQLPTARGGAGSGFIDGKLYVAGGDADSSPGGEVATLGVYDPATGTWQVLSPMLTARADVMAGVIDGRLYVVGGRSNGTDGLGILEIYDPATDTWATGPAMPTPRYGGAAAVIDGKLYVAGGWGNGTYLTALEVFDPFTETWDESKSQAFTARVGVFAVVLAGKFYLMGGERSAGIAAHMQIYDPVTNSWTSPTTLKTPRRDAAVAVFYDRIFIFGGRDASGSLDTVEYYDVSENKWYYDATDVTHISTPRTNLDAGIWNNVIYLVGGEGSDRLESYSRLAYRLELTDGLTLPVPPDSITVTASNIRDVYGHNIGATLDTTFVPYTGEPPIIILDKILGRVRQDVPIAYSITDPEFNPVSLLVQASLDTGKTWQVATITGDTTDITFVDYQSSLIWKTEDDLPGKETLARVSITPRDTVGVWGVSDTIYVHVDNKPPAAIHASGVSGDSTYTFWFDEPVADSTATNANYYQLLPDTLDIRQQISVIESTVSYRALLKSGQRLPAVDLTLKAWSIADTLGNRLSPGDTLSVMFPPTTGEVPAVDTLWVIDPVGEVVSGDVTIGRRISDQEGSPVTLRVEFSSDTTWAGERSWHPATVTGDTLGLLPAAYEGSLVWKSKTDMDTLDIEDVWLKITPYDNPDSLGQAYSLQVHVDNRAPQWVKATGSSGDSTITLGFDEPVTALPVENVSLSSGYTVGSIVPQPGGDFLLTLSSGQLLPSPPDSVTVTVSGVADSLGNTTPVLTATFVPWTGSRPSVVFDPITGARAGDVTIGYVIADDEHNLVSLLMETSPDSLIWGPARVSGDTLDLAFSHYDSSLTWASATDYPDQELDVWLRITPYDTTTVSGDPIPGTPDVIRVRIDNRAPQLNGARAVSSDSIVTFWFNEPADTTTALDETHYSLTGESVGILPIGDIWLTAAPDTFLLELQDGDTLPYEWLTLKAWSIADTVGNVLSSEDTLFTMFRPNTGAVPVVDTLWVIDPVGEVVSGDVTIGRRISDRECNPVTLRVVFSIDTTGTGERIWLPATVVGDTLDLLPAAYEDSLVWQSKADLDTLDIEDIWLKITPYDTPSSLGQPDSLQIHVDNRAPQWIEATGSSGDSTITLWFDEPVPVLPVENISLSPGYTVGSIVLRSGGNFLLTLSSGQLLPSPPDSVTVTVSAVADSLGNTIPVLTVTFVPWTGSRPSVVLDTVTGARAGDVTIGYVIADDEHNLVSLLVETSPDSMSWNPATVLDGTLDLVFSHYDSSFAWASATDYPDQELDAWLRITPYDTTMVSGDPIPGTPDVIRVRIDNRAPQLNGARAVSSDSIVTFWFNEPADTTTALNETHYRLTGESVGILPIVDIRPTAAPDTFLLELEDGYFLPYEWLTLKAWSIADTVGNILGSGDTLSTTFQPTTGAVPLVGTLWVIDPVGEVVSGDVTIGYRITDQEGNPVTLRVVFSIDTTGTGERIWHPATVVGDTLDLLPAAYEGSLVWQSKADQDTLDVEDVWLKITPYDNPSSLGQPDSLRVHVDNRAPQRIEAEGAVGEGVVRFWFNEPVSDESAMQIDHFLLTGEGTGGRVIGPITRVSGTDTLNLALAPGDTLHFERMTLEAWAISDTLGNTVAESDTLRREFIPRHPNADPSLTMTEFTTKVGGDIPVSYVIEDTEGDPVNISPRYSLDMGMTWRMASVEEDTLVIPLERYAGTLTWYSELDLGSLDSRQLTTADLVWFRILPADKPLLFGIGDTIRVHVDNNHAPLDTSISSEYSAADSSWAIIYKLDDAEKDTLSITLEYRRIEESGWHLATTRGDTTGLSEDKYVGLLEWLIERDLPLYAGDVVIRLTPRDLDAGTAGLDTLWHNPYNAPQLGITTEYSTEQSDTLWVDFEVPDSGRPVRIQAEFRLRNTGYDTSHYMPATIVGDTLVTAESGRLWTIGWTSLTDAPGVDWDSTAFKLVPYDGDTGLRGIADSLFVHLDNNTPPEFIRMWSGPVMVHSDTIYYELNDREEDTLDIDGRWSYDPFTAVENCSLMTLVKGHTGITPDRYLGYLVWDSFRDVGYGDTLIYVQLMSSDHDPGKPDTTSFRLSNWAGDYDGDLSIDFGDFAVLVAAYNDQDASKDIGPAEGTPPNLRPTSQEPIEIDIFDLAVFAQMRTWYLRNGSQTSTVALARSNSLSLLKEKTTPGDQHPVRLTQNQTENVWESNTEIVTFRITAESVQGLMAAGIVVRYAPEALEYIEATPGDFLGRTTGEKANLFHLESAEPSQGSIELLLGRLDRSEPVVDGSGLLATLRFRRLGSDHTALSVEYDLRGRQAQTLAAGYFGNDLRADSIPLRFTLHQNFPNPFNGETVIRFQLPTRERVRLYVLNVRGQRVATLLDQEMDPGFHQITWSGVNNEGRRVASGIYIYLIQAGSHVQSRKMILLK